MPAKEGNGRKGQAPVEIISMTIIITVLLLLVLITTYNRNEDTERLLSTNEKSVQCSRMSSAIARIYSNRAGISETLHVQTTSDLNRLEGKPGQISVGNVSCNYLGRVMSGNQTDNTTGIRLSVGDWCFEKSDSNVAVSQGECQ